MEMAVICGFCRACANAWAKTHETVFDPVLGPFGTPGGPQGYHHLLRPFVTYHQLYFHNVMTQTVIEGVPHQPQ